MSGSINSDVTLMTEHLTYRPAALIDDIVNSINVLAFKASEAVEKGLLSADPSNLGFKASPRSTEASQATTLEKAKHEIENGVHQLETLLEAKIDKNFDKLEIYALRNILSVPPEVRDWVRLSHYEGLSFVPEGGGQGEEPNTESVTLQRRKLRETQKLHALLRAESARNEATIRALRGVLLEGSGIGNGGVEKREAGVEGEGQSSATIAFLQKKGGLTGDVKHPVTTTTEFTLSQLPALKSLLENLKARLAELANGGGKEGLVGEEEKSWRRERLEFVERETRRHLENVRGLELGDMGEVRDGEWQGEGRKLGKGEVEDLERVVGMVSGEPMDQGP